MTLERDGAVRVISNGQSWHAGTGTWPSIGTNNGNAYCLGVECVYNGSDITGAQRDAYPRLAAALVRRYGIPVGNVIGHREWATPSGRKVDPGQIDLPGFRRTVQALVNGAAPAPPTTPKEEDLPSVQDVWANPVPDLYTDNPNDVMPAWVSLSWATVHAAHAKDQATASLKAVQDLTAALRDKGVID